MDVRIDALTKAGSSRSSARKEAGDAWFKSAEYADSIDGMSTKERERRKFPSPTRR